MQFELVPIFVAEIMVRRWANHPYNIHAQRIVYMCGICERVCSSLPYNKISISISQSIAIWANHQRIDVRLILFYFIACSHNQFNVCIKPINQPYQIDNLANAHFERCSPNEKKKEERYIFVTNAIRTKKSSQMIFIWFFSTLNSFSWYTMDGKAW